MNNSYLYQNFIIEILYEDNDIAILNKPSGLLTHKKNLSDSSPSLAESLKINFDIKDDEQTFKEFFKPFLILFLLSPITYGLVSLISENKRTDYRGKVEANKVLQVWQKDFTEKINVVLGDEWHAGNISYHMEGRPVWLGKINQKNVDLLNAYICTKKVCVGYR